MDAWSTCDLLSAGFFIYLLSMTTLKLTWIPSCLLAFFCETSTPKSHRHTHKAGGIQEVKKMFCIWCVFLASISSFFSLCLNPLYKYEWWLDEADAGWVHVSWVGQCLCEWDVKIETYLCVHVCFPACVCRCVEKLYDYRASEGFELILMS